MLPTVRLTLSARLKAVSVSLSCAHTRTRTAVTRTRSAHGPMERVRNRFATSTPNPPARPQIANGRHQRFMVGFAPPPNAVAAPWMRVPVWRNAKSAMASASTVSASRPASARVFPTVIVCGTQPPTPANHLPWIVCTQAGQTGRNAVYPAAREPQLDRGR